MSLTRFIIAALVALSCLSQAAERPVIYQLFVRHFGNENEMRRPWGSLAENGCGKFADITAERLASLRELGSTHVWLTGVLQQATRTDYTAIGQPPDDPDICKGVAGSPYAVKDWFDVCPDYAVDPSERLHEFRALVRRCHDAGLKVILDFIPNHVSRAYGSDVRPDLSFGAQDDRSVFFARDNSFYYLRSGRPPLRLPTAMQPGCDGLFDGEMDHGRVTGNNITSWMPGDGDWYETVKLNYGWNFLHGRPAGGAFADGPPPRTWMLMDEVLAHWQGMGVDGFRCDMAHMVPMDFWQWALKRARERDAAGYFIAEAYDNDPAKLAEGNVLEALLKAGFDAVYDDPSYDVVKGIHDGNRWANDLARLIQDESPLFHRSLRYAENHDEARLASPLHWRGAGMRVGLPVSALLFSLGRGPLMIYNGQEVGEAALGAEGHGTEDGRTTIFDYWSLPELVKWRQNRLSPDQQTLRQGYAALLRTLSDPVFTRGKSRLLNAMNAANADYGRLEGETASGHWLGVVLRQQEEAGRAALVITNLHPTLAMRDVRVRVPEELPLGGFKVTAIAGECPPLEAGAHELLLRGEFPALAACVVWLEAPAEPAGE